MFKRFSVLLSASLVACGGGSATSVPEQSGASIVQGTVTGLSQGATLLLSNNGTESVAVAADGQFAFPTKISEGSAYNVTIIGEPSGANCSVANGSGTALHGVDKTNLVTVTCVPGAVAAFRFNVGVTVTGLPSGQTLVLMNNGSDTITATKDGLVVFPDPYLATAIYSGKAGGYEVTVKTQPSGKTCTLSGASGANTGGSGNFVNINATCK